MTRCQTRDARNESGEQERLSKTSRYMKQDAIKDSVSVSRIYISLCQIKNQCMVNRLLISTNPMYTQVDLRKHTKVQDTLRPRSFLLLRSTLYLSFTSITFRRETCNRLHILGLKWRQSQNMRDQNIAPFVLEFCKRTLRYSFVSSWYSLVMVFGGPRASSRTRANRTHETTKASTTMPKTCLPSPGGSKARGPWGPNAIQYAKIKNRQQMYNTSNSF